MLRLLLPTSSINECKKQWDRLVARKQKRFQKKFQSISQRVKERYEEYFTNRGNPETIEESPWSGDKSTADLLKKCYCSGASLDKEIVESARSVSTIYCPYCCLQMPPQPMGKNDESDHFLPRSCFPEYSTLAINLVTSCHHCNNHKSDDFVASDGSRLFLHPYFDDCLTSQLLSAEVIDGRDGVPSLEYKIIDTVTEFEECSTINNHILTLDLLSRYPQAVMQEFTTILQTIADLCSTIQEARNYFTKLSTKILEVRPNDPRGLIYQAAGNSRELERIISRARSSKNRLQNSMDNK